MGSCAELTRAIRACGASPPCAARGDIPPHRCRARLFLLYSRRERNILVRETIEVVKFR